MQKEIKIKYLADIEPVQAISKGDWMNTSGVQPKQIVAVTYDNDWRNVIWWVIE